jgi:hypothetical protein
MSLFPKKDPRCKKNEGIGTGKCVSGRMGDWLKKRER